MGGLCGDVNAAEPSSVLPFEERVCRRSLTRRALRAVRGDDAKTAERVSDEPDEADDGEQETVMVAAAVTYVLRSSFARRDRPPGSGFALGSPTFRFRAASWFDEPVVDCLYILTGIVRIEMLEQTV